MINLALFLFRTMSFSYFSFTSHHQISFSQPTPFLLIIQWMLVWFHMRFIISLVQQTTLLLLQIINGILKGFDGNDFHLRMNLFRCFFSGFIV